MTIVESAALRVVVARYQRTLTRDVEFCDKHRECDADDLSPYHGFSCFTRISARLMLPIKSLCILLTFSLVGLDVNNILVR